jgi:hypothetical protein
MATTTNYGWTTPDDTALVKDGASAIRTLGSSVDTTTKNLNPETTLGDIAYRSSTANVKTRLALGTSNQVLRVNSGATAPEWATLATPSSGATLISRTTFSASASVTVDSLFSTTYENYLVCIQALGSNANVQLQMQGRYGATTHTGTNYQFGFSGIDSTAATLRTLYNYDQTKWSLGLLATGNPNVHNYTIFRPNGSGLLQLTGGSRSNYDGANFSGGAFIDSSQLWTGLVISPASGTITGQISVYGLAVS